MIVDTLKNCMILLAVVLPSQILAVAHAEGDWRSIYVEGAKIGHGFRERRVSDDIVTIEEMILIKTDQPGALPVKLQIELLTDERTDGTPLRFRKKVVTGNIETLIEGKFEDDKVIVTTSLNGEVSTSTIQLETAILFPDGQRRLFMAAAEKQCTSFKFHTFDFTSLAPVTTEATLLGTETIDIMGSQRVLNKVIQHTYFPGDRLSSLTVYYDSVWEPQRVITDLLGEEAIMEVTSKSKALSRDRAFDHLEKTLIRSPYVMSVRALNSAIRFELKTKDGTPLTLPETFEQHIRRSGDAVEVDVCDTCGREKAPTQEELQSYLNPTIWLQSDHPELVSVAEKAVRRAKTDRDKMKKLTRVVTKKMHGRIYFIGYATALEAFRTGQGDCTEYALLLATLGRAAGIPTRVVNGIVYSQERFHGRKWVFVPHAWVQAWIDDRWVSFDGALGDFDASHIAFGISDGDQSSFIASMHVVDSIEIISAGMLVKPPAEQKH